MGRTVTTQLIRATGTHFVGAECAQSAPSGGNAEVSDFLANRSAAAQGHFSSSATHSTWEVIGNT